jgi:ABC-type uncharacterized transport system permease subunit
MKRLVPALTVFVSLALATPATAADGIGTAGRVDDKYITLFCFGVMIFFAVMVITLSYIQGRLEGRKERVRDELERLRRP